jgi:hypothetical protein
MDGIVWRQADLEVTLKTVRNSIVKDERWVDEPRCDRLVVPDADPAFQLAHIFLSFQPGYIVHGISVKTHQGRQAANLTRSIKAFPDGGFICQEPS